MSRISPSSVLPALRSRRNIRRSNRPLVRRYVAAPVRYLVRTTELVKRLTGERQRASRLAGFVFVVDRQLLVGFVALARVSQRAFPEFVRADEVPVTLCQPRQRRAGGTIGFRRQNGARSTVRTVLRARFTSPRRSQMRDTPYSSNPSWLVTPRRRGVTGCGPRVQPVREDPSGCAGRPGTSGSACPPRTKSR